MKTWKTVAISVITTASLVTIGSTAYNYLQPTHYEGDTFTNVSTSVSNTSTSTSVSSSTEPIKASDSSTNTDSVYTESSNTEQVTEGTTPAYNPTFKVECVNAKQDLYSVEHIPTGDKIKAVTYDEAMAFCSYMEQIAHGKTSLSYSMQENYNTLYNN